MHRLDPSIFSGSVKSFWRTRERQADLQRQRGQTDQGSRSAVTGGRQMDGFSEIISITAQRKRWEPPWTSGPPIGRALSVHLLLPGWVICCFWRIARNRGVRLGSENLIFLFFRSFTMPLIQSVMSCSAGSWSGRGSIILPALSLQIARAQTPLRIIMSPQRISQQLNLSLSF